MIRFSNDTGSVMLGPTTVAADGNVSWSWTPGQIGLTVGQWKIEVVASRGGHDASTSDPLGLQVVS